MSIFTKRRIMIPRKTHDPNKLKQLDNLKAIKSFLFDIEINLNYKIKTLEEKLFIIKIRDKTQ